MFPQPILDLYQHNKTGKMYVLLHNGLLEHDKTPIAVYRSIIDGTVWVRPSDEFFDGRFTRIGSVRC